MTILPVIQAFFGRPVRFFKTEFTLDLGGVSRPPQVIASWGIPFPDFCLAIDYPEKEVRQKINLDSEVYQGMHTTMDIIDANGVQRRRTRILSYEMCMLMIAKLETSRIKDPEKRAMVISFQRSLMYMFHLLRTGKLRGAYIFKSGAPAEYQRLLSLPPGRATASAVRELAAAEGLCFQQVYSRLRKIRGSNAITCKGVPKKRRCTAGVPKNHHRAA